MYLRHADLWRAIDDLARDHGYTISALARRAGLDLAQACELLGAGAAGSRILQLRGPMMVRGVFEPATMKLDLWDKDLRLIDAFARAEAARLVSVPTLLTEQYPKGLGPTVAALAEILPPPLTKMSFSCCGEPGFGRAIPAGVSAFVLCGIETHVCVAQTALDLMATGTSVFIAVDAVTSRHSIDHETALRRLTAAGAILTTSEAILFEWCGSAEHPQFQAIRRLVLT